MNWKIYDADGNYLQTIYGSESFVISYCERNGYTYELIDVPISDRQKNLIIAYKLASHLSDYVNSYFSKIFGESSCGVAFLAKEVIAINSLKEALYDTIREEGLEMSIEQVDCGSPYTPLTNNDYDE